MNLPKRIVQHQHQSESFAILLYKFRKEGIFRNLTENDYGIDFEIEQVVTGKLTGNYVKAQVKSAEKMKVRDKDQVPTISGIKQSTLLYWAELSFSTHVIVFAVDLKTEDIYNSGPIFWQATKLLDKSQKTKTIEFRPNMAADNKLSPEENKKISDFVTSTLLQLTFLMPKIPDIIQAHTGLIRNFADFGEMYEEIFRHDPWMPIGYPERFAHFLGLCAVLLDGLFRFKQGKTEDETHIFSYAYWSRKDSGELSNSTAQVPLKMIMNPLIKKLKDLQDSVRQGAYYWLHKNIGYLRLVDEFIVPLDATPEHILQIDKSIYARSTWPDIISKYG